MFLAAPCPRLRGFSMEGGYCPPGKQALELATHSRPKQGFKGFKRGRAQLHPCP